MDKRKLCVYDTMSGKYTDVEVTDEVYIHYNRTQWNIDDNDDSFFKHEIQFSALTGGLNDAFENFKEFKTEYDETEKKAVHKVLVKRLYDCLNFLPENDRKLIQMIFIEGKHERECAEILCISQQNLHKKTKRILANLNKLLKSE